MALDQRVPETPAAPAELERLSALLDGECTDLDAAAFTRRWRSDGALQRHWDTYHLIGDALRSDDLCRLPADDRFMAGLRVRLAAEPTVLAPAPLERPAPRRLRWMRPVSAAAGVMAVAGSVWLLPVRQAGVQAPPALATAPQPPAPAARPTARAAAEWDRYLAAHQQFQSAAAVVPVSGYLRQADHDASQR